MSNFGNIFKKTASIASNQWKNISNMHLKTATLSKSSFVMGCQCTKLMWLHKYKYAERKVSVETQSKFDRDHIIGELAQHLFPDGIDASDNINNINTFKKVLANSRKSPNVAPGEHCQNPYECPFAEYC